MTDYMRKEMEVLMGGLGHGDDAVEFTDRSVCKKYLLGLCTNDMFDNTRFQLPLCGKTHSQAMREEYLNAKKRGESFGFEKDVFRYYERLTFENENYMKSQQRKLDAEQRAKEGPPNGPEAEEVAAIATLIGEKLSIAESLGEEGEVDASMEMMNEVEMLKNRKTELENIITAKQKVGGQKLKVCEVCGSYLNEYDAEQRLQDHQKGKLHMGRIEIKEKYEQMKKDFPHFKPNENDGSYYYQAAPSIHAKSKGGGSKSRDRDSDRDRDRDRDRDYRTERGGRRESERDYRDRPSDRDYRDRERDYRDRGSRRR